MQEEVRTAQEMLVRIWMGYFERSEELCIVKWACSMITHVVNFFSLIGGLRIFIMFFLFYSVMLKINIDEYLDAVLCSDSC